MSRKSLIYIGAAVGSFVGGYIPVLWGADVLSVWSILLGGVGGIAGIWLAYRLT